MFARVDLGAAAWRGIYATRGVCGVLPSSEVGSRVLARLVCEVRTILARAIEAGGSSLRDYVDSSGQAGHFQDTFRVYDRDGKPCMGCGTPLRLIRQGNRSTFYCVKCQR